MNSPRVASAVSVIVAADRGGLIGSGGGIPWRIPEDLRRFRRMTMGRLVIMGRKTFEALPRTLDGRRIVVMTRNAAYVPPPGAVAARTVEEALSLAAGEEAFVAGGAQVYGAFFPRATTFHLTSVEGSFEGDAWLPPIDWSEWTLVAEEPCPGAPACAFRRYERIRGERA
jgi:dihydrofolate reductase